MRARVWNRDDGAATSVDQPECVLCGSADLTRCSDDLPRLGTREPSRFHLARCRACGALHTRPLPTAEELAEEYGAAFTWRPTPSVTTSLEAIYRRALVRVDHLRTLRRAARLAPGNRLLDIGCGDGLVISEARRHAVLAFGLDRADVPLWPGCAPEWRMAGNIDTTEQQPESWDIVSLFHVAEHLTHPIQILTRIHGWLRPGGILIVQTPNAGCLEATWLGGAWRGWDVPRHVVHFTPETLSHTVRAAGFEVVALQHLSWRDNATCCAGSLLPTFDIRIDRQAMRRAPSTRSPLVTLGRRLLYAAVTLAATPIMLIEAAFGRAPTVTVLARKPMRRMDEMPLASA